MKYWIYFLVLIFIACDTMPDMSKWKEIPKSDFLKAQLQFPRVREAFQQKEEDLKILLLEHGIESFEFDLFLRAFKKEEKLELWVKPKGQSSYQKIKTYDFCKNSGTLGPKRKEGDGQIPEGFYRISHYNPKSSFLLSLKVNYPNSSDRLLSDQEKPGDDIYIHGGCQTIGCIPITNDKIQEVYLLSVLAKKEGLSLPIHIFPFKMTDEKIANHLETFPQYKAFWLSLKRGFGFFEKEKTLPEVSVSARGSYSVE